MRSIRSWWQVAAGCLVGAFALTAALGNPVSRPNVLFIAADDLRTSVGSYGDPVAITPHLDALAARGVLFERAYCQQALCNPSRASLLTGRRPDTLRVWDLTTHFRETNPSIVTLPQHFKQQGYHTQNIGKIFHNWRTKIPGDPDSWSVPAILHFATHRDDVAQTEGAARLVNPIPFPGAESLDVPDEAYFDGRVAAAAVDALKVLATREQPFFLAVGFWKPHAPFNAPRRYWDLYQRDAIAPPAHPKLPINAPPIAAHRAGQAMKELAENPQALATFRHGYYAAISYLDAQVGRVIGELDRLGLANNTVIVFWSDHGLHLGEHGLWEKSSNYELDARVPLIVAAPGFRDKTRTRALVEFIDIFPTLVDLCGLPQVPGLEGKSLRRVLADPRASVRDAAFTQHPRPHPLTGPPLAMGYAARTDRYRYVEWREWKTGQPIAFELYDHQVDGNETINLAGTAEHAAVQVELASRLVAQFPRQSLPSL